MNEPIRAPYPAEPVASPNVATWQELRFAYNDHFGQLDQLIPLPKREYNSPDRPDPNHIGTSERERSWPIDGDGGYTATDSERLDLLRQCAEERIQQIHARIALAEELAEFYAAHRDEIEAYLDERKAWRDACLQIDHDYREARNEIWRERERARYNVGDRVRPFRARNGWEIIARNGKGAIIRELRYDDKPARIRELADILEIV